MARRSERRRRPKDEPGFHNPPPQMSPAANRSDQAEGSAATGPPRPTTTSSHPVRSLSGFQKKFVTQCLVKTYSTNGHSVPAPHPSGNHGNARAEPRADREGPDGPYNRSYRHNEQKSFNRPAVLFVVPGRRGGWERAR